MRRTLVNRRSFVRRTCVCGSPAATDAARGSFTGQITYLIRFAFFLFCLFFVLVLSRSISILLLVLPVLFDYSAIESRDSIIVTSALPNTSAMPKLIRQNLPDVTSCPHGHFRFRQLLRRRYIASFGRHRMDRRHCTSIDRRYTQSSKRDRCDVNHARNRLWLEDLYNARERSYDDMPGRRDMKRTEAVAECGCAIGFHSSDNVRLSAHRDEIIPSRKTL